MPSFSSFTKFTQSITCGVTGTDHASPHSLPFPPSSCSSTLFFTPYYFPLSSLAPNRLTYTAGDFRGFNPNTVIFLQSSVAWGSSFQEFYVKLHSLFFFPRDFPPVQPSDLEGREKEENRGIKGRERPYLFSHSSGYHLENVLPPAECTSLGFECSLAWAVKGSAATGITTALQVLLLRVWRQLLGPK